MGIGGDDRLEGGARHGRDVGGRQHLVEPLLADPADIVAGIRLPLVEDPEIDSGRLQQRREGLRDFLVARVERRIVADEPQHLHGLLARILDREWQRLGPGGPLALRFSERVAGLVDGLQGLLQQRVHVACFHELAERDLLLARD